MTQPVAGDPAEEWADSEVEPALQFYIPATSSIQERRPRTLKHGDTFGVFDHYGNILSANGSPEGLFHRDTRYLSELRLVINGRRPLLLSSTVLDNNALMTADLTNPDFFDGNTLVLPKDTIHIIRSKFLWNAGCHERLGVHNFGGNTQRLRLALLFAADFADIFEIRGHERQARGSTDVEVGPDRVVFGYLGLDRVARHTSMRFDPAPSRIDARHVVFDLELRPGERTSVFSLVYCEEGEVREDPRTRWFSGSMREARRALRAAMGRGASIETSNEVFNEVLGRSVADLHMLVTDTGYGPYPYAGIPWFSTAFGRDAIITAMEMLWIDPAMARGVLDYLAATQATETDPAAEAEPGKILHEARFGEMAGLGEVPFARYYGSVDSTPLFVLLAGLYFERTGDLDTAARLWPHIEAALAWIKANARGGRSGFTVYHRDDSKGLANQGWKDSADSTYHADGIDAAGAIALCEVQGYVYAARRQAANIAAALGHGQRARELLRDAKRLKARFETAFWCEDIGTYAMAIDGTGRPCAIRSSNAGQLLFTGIVEEERAGQVADQLMSQTFFSGWGIRTIADSEARHNPMSYHNGSVWPHDNALIGFGLARHGFKDHLSRLFAGMFDAATYMDLRRLPELFCGFRRVAGKGPTFYPVACAPQAWASATPFALLQASLGIEIDCIENTVHFRQPRLPPFIDEVNIRSLAVGGSRLDILLRRYGTDVSVNVLNRDGDARVDVTL
ncbi:MAG: amylo-alpha-1,6-glucosidase [Bauldia sp.]|uniref:amylo-alpha-1,6-glucosidase n=1 Tax=Bauldia sp. TaxID=2575872 RepID=UPI001E14204C|nr:amylo-alpha-1,6-glucosidase [Bauldia sp.]MCB1497713.1 amylo-alpha-1,6-glucosidase [Bauldia sp.]